MAHNIENLEKTVTIVRKDADNALAIAKKAIADKDLVGYSKAIATLTDKTKALNECICKVEYAKFLASGQPMITAVKQFYIANYKVKEHRDKNDNTISNVTLEKKQARIDLDKFCEFGELDRTWASDSSKLLALLSLRETNVYAMSPVELSKKSFYFIDMVAAKKDGKTPDSNRQIVQLLQKIIDEAIFVDDGNGNNRYKCTNHDIAFIQDAVTKIDAKEKCTIAMLNERQFKTVMMSVFVHCLGEVYTVKAAKIKEA